MMESTVIRPRFCETDALRHISNTVLPVWFEGARECFFSRLHPTMGFDDWPVILARLEVDYKAQVYLGHDVTLKTGIEKMGTSSIVVYQEAHQRDQLVAVGRCILVYFDFKTERSKPIPDDIRANLSELAITEDITE